MVLQELGSGTGYLKAGFLGFAKSGKTHTAASLGIGLREFFGLKGPIAFFDTEGGSEYVAPRIRKSTGMAPVGVRSRSLDELISVTAECEKEGVSVLLVDSVTHIWREVCESAILEINKDRKKRGRYPINKLEFQHWGPIKQRWSVWTDAYLNSKLHIIICGRAGYEYDYEAISDDEHAKKELVKTGIKMKTEGEFGFEPSLLIEMERIQEIREDTKIIHRATVLGDRFNVIDGLSCNNPDFEFFLPHVDCLRPGTHAPIDVAAKTKLGLDHDGHNEDGRMRRRREILCEEIQALIVRKYPGQTAAEKKAKAELISKVFNTGSWTKVESLSIGQLEDGLHELQRLLAPSNPVDQVPVAGREQAASDTWVASEEVSVEATKEV